MIKKRDLKLKKSKKPYNHISKYTKRNINNIINKRYSLLIMVILIIMTTLIVNLFIVQIINNNYYKNQVDILSQKIVYGDPAPRGRIYDIKGRIIVDNKAKRVIFYKKTNGITIQKELENAYKVASLIEVNYSNLHPTNLKEFWLASNKEIAKQRITDKEWKQLEERKIKSSDIDKYKMERITDKDLEKYNELDKEAAYIYYLMNKGYYNDEKTIKNIDVSDEEYAVIAENIDSLQGFDVKLSWDRYYPYKDTFRVLLGNVSSDEVGVPYDLKNYYLEKGYSLNDRVGTSFLEYQYEDILRGTRNKYKLLNDGSKILLEEGKRGNDIVLTIDIELQKQIEDILISQIEYSVRNENMKYYNRSFAIIQNPKTGGILAMAGKQVINQNGEYISYDYSPGVVITPVTVGSAIKGASHIVGYNNGALTIGEVRKDECIKIAATPIKCSWTKLGTLNDITALKQSSNVYQYLTAIKVGKGNYVKDHSLTIDESAFDKYRQVFQEFGLGVSTGIDLPIESLGYKGTSRLPGLLLDFAIGQYDTYTPLQLSEYIGTIANNGSRMQAHLLDSVYEPTKEPLTKLISKYEPKVLNVVNTKPEYLERVKQGFKEVLSPSGTGYNYVDISYNPAGKTGTSESFIDTNNDGMIDTETLSNTFVAYAPYDNPQVTFTIVSPDIGYYSNGLTIRSYVNRRISYEVSKKYFEIYK